MSARDGSIDFPNATTPVDFVETMRTATSERAQIITQEWICDALAEELHLHAIALPGTIDEELVRTSMIMAYRRAITIARSYPVAS